MPRPTKWRRVDFIPQVTSFLPAGTSHHSLEEVCLSFEELEAIRLKDTEELEQEDCAERMKVSRPTFHRVLESARKKEADVLVNGKALRIEGGNFEMSTRRFRCADDGHQWDLPFEAMVNGTPLVCPRCYSSSVQSIPLSGYTPGQQCCRRRHRRKQCRRTT